jgi:hypothetical protein
MKRLAILFGTLVLATQISGCGNGAPSGGGQVTGTPTPEADLPEEVKKEMRREEEFAKKAAARQAAVEAKKAKKATP